MANDTSPYFPGTNRSFPHPNDEEADGDADAEKTLAEALASLQLPHMPSSPDDDDDDDGGGRALPSITILVCADIDLASTSALAEYLLMDQPHITVDLIIAAGPCTRDEDLLAYCQGSAQRSKYKRRQQQQQQHFSASAPPAAAQHSSPYFSSAEPRHGGVRTALSPFYRSAEESAAMEGLVTSALSQLECIVCRVLYCPGFSDPFTVILDADSKRLTPNSRNLHRQWLPMVPGLGCAGIFYLDGTEQVSNAVTASTCYADDSDASDDEEENEINSAMLMTEQVKKMQQSPSGYLPTLSKLLQLAPEADKHNPLHSGKAQSILVTHYVDGRKLLLHDDEGDSISRTDDGQGDLDDLFHAAHYLGLGNGDTGSAVGPRNDDNDAECNGCSAIPWPIGHKKFLMDDSTLRHLCFEIASGSAVSHPAAWINQGKDQNVGSRSSMGVGSCCCCSNRPVLLPGSLRERGEFSIVKVSLVEQGTKTERRRFAWEVQNVDFYNIGHYE